MTLRMIILLELCLISSETLGGGRLLMLDDEPECALGSKFSRRLRQQVEQARIRDERVSVLNRPARRITDLPPNGFIHRLPRDIHVLIATMLPTSSLARLNEVCRAFNQRVAHRCPIDQSIPYECSVTEDALRLRAARDGLHLPPRSLLPLNEPTWVCRMLEAEVLHTLRQSLTTVSEGCVLVLDVRSSTGYAGVKFMCVCLNCPPEKTCEHAIRLSNDGIVTPAHRPWNAPWKYKAEIDGISLGSFITAVSAAVAVAQYCWVNDNPCL